ncbi:MAG: NUDIX domain-containing protein [Actinomycetota bacterium]|nr:NUDIX domain-containing protein [Actinomycetota bacterium]
MTPPRRPELAVGAVVRRNGALLLVQRDHEPDAGLWSVPGGRVVWGEPMAQAAERELAEETGLVGRCGPLVGWVERIDHRHHFVIADFAVEVDRTSPATAGSDARRLAWVPVAEVSTYDLVDGLLAFLRRHGVVPPPGS